MVVEVVSRSVELQHKVCGLSRVPSRLHRDANHVWCYSMSGKN